MDALEIERRKMQAGFVNGDGPAVQQVQSDRGDAAIAAGRVVTIGDRTFYMRPETITQSKQVFEAMREFAQKHMKSPLDTALKIIQDNATLDDATKSMLIDRALNAQCHKSGKTIPTNEQILDVFRTTEGVRYYTWLKCNIASPNEPVTQEWVAKHVTEDNIDAIGEVFGELTKLNKLDPDAPKV